MQAQKQKILLFIDWYLPGVKAGGPIRSAANLVQRLSPDFHFRVVTGNTDLNETTPYPGITSDEWNTLEDGTEVFYCSKKSLSHDGIEKIILTEKPDVIYLNSMFSPYFTLIPLLIAKRKKLNTKIVVAPRGMLSKGALAIKSTKKKIFLSFAKTMGLFRGLTWHASTEIEKNEIHKSFGQQINIIHAINLTPARNIVRIPRKKNEGSVRLIYVGRVSEVKNLLQCITALQDPGLKGEYLFDIYGPFDEPDYFEECKKQIAKLPANIKATYKGMIENDQVIHLLPDYHFLFLLTHNENFGHAIVEAFSSGCPAIISDRTPWRKLEAEKCGWDLHLNDHKAITHALNTACNMSQEKYNEWSEAAYEKADSIFNNKEALQNNRKLFMNMN